MPTPTLKRRLQRLEAIGQRERELAPERCRFITRAAVQHLSTDELRSALGANEALREGREPTGQELAAANALNAATEVECRRAGMTLVEFNRNLAAGPPRPVDVSEQGQYPSETNLGRIVVNDEI